LIALRLLWLKAKARADRWEEEVALVSEEMRRVERYLESEKNWWIQQSSRRGVEAAERGEGIDLALNEGLVAYAMEQRDLRSMLGIHFKYLWGGVSAWIAAKEVPKGKYWFSQVVKPEDSPALMFPTQTVFYR
jgi:hypothetical protein